MRDDGIFSSVSQIGMFFFYFPVSGALGTRLKGRPEKLCDFIGCNTSNHVQVRSG